MSGLQIWTQKNQYSCYRILRSIQDPYQMEGGLRRIVLTMKQLNWNRFLRNCHGFTCTAMKMQWLKVVRLRFDLKTLAQRRLSKRSANAQPTLSQCSANAQPTLSQQSATLSQRWANAKPTLSQHSTNAQPMLRKGRENASKYQSNPQCLLSKCSANTQQTLSKRSANARKWSQHANYMDSRWISKFYWLFLPDSIT